MCAIRPVVCMVRPVVVIGANPRFRGWTRGLAGGAMSWSELSDGLIQFTATTAGVAIMAMKAKAMRMSGMGELLDSVESRFLTSEGEAAAKAGEAGKAVLGEDVFQGHRCVEGTVWLATHASSRAARVFERSGCYSESSDASLLFAATTAGATIIPMKARAMMMSCIVGVPGVASNRRPHGNHRRVDLNLQYN